MCLRSNRRREENEVYEYWTLVESVLTAVDTLVRMKLRMPTRLKTIENAVEKIGAAQADSPGKSPLFPLELSNLS